MLFKFFAIVLIFPVIAFVLVLIKSLVEYKRFPNRQYNIVASNQGIPSIIHENASKEISESIKGAEKAFEEAGIKNFSVDDFLDSLR